MGLVAFKFLVDEVAETDSEAIRAPELELSNLSLQECKCDVSKLRTKLVIIINTLKTNGAFKIEHNTEVINALSDPACCKDFYLHLLSYQWDVDKKVNVNAKLILANIDNKHNNLKSQRNGPRL